MKKEILKTAEDICNLNRIRCELFKEEKENIINNKIQNNLLIERTLDRYMDLTDFPNGEKTYLELCRYYGKIDKEAADFYYNCYLESCDNQIDNSKTKKLGFPS